VVNLNWHDAVAQAEHLFTAAERAAGWPETLSNAQVAALQRPPTTRSAFHRAIESACQGGELVHTATTVQAPLAAYAIKYSDGRPPPQRQYKTVTVLTVRAKDVVTWLAAQEEAPSAHIAAWLKATTAQPVQPAAGVKAGSANRPSDSDLLAELERRGGRQKRGALQETADHFGLDRSTVGKAIRRAEQAMTAKYGMNSALPKGAQPSTWMVEMGKKVKSSPH
jgi:hypothetical protein